MAGVPTVVDVSDDPGVRGDHRACSGGGNTQEEHGLTAQELSYTGAQDLPAIGLSVKKEKIYIYSQSRVIQHNILTIKVIKSCFALFLAGVAYL